MDNRCERDLALMAMFLQGGGRPRFAVAPAWPGTARTTRMNMAQMRRQKKALPTVGDQIKDTEISGRDEQAFSSAAVGQRRRSG